MPADEDAMGADEELKAILMELRMPQKRQIHAGLGGLAGLAGLAYC